MSIKASIKLVILFIILVTSLSYKNALAVIETTIKQPVTVKIKPEIKVALELANKYKNIDELIAASDVVVFGKFTENPKIVLPSQGLSLPPRLYRKVLDPFIISQILASRDPGHRTITFVPIQTIKGSTSKAITVGQRGTFTEFYTVPNKGDKFFQTGDTYILFLTLEPARSNNFYWITGAVQGAFQVKSDRVNYPQIKSESLDNFLQLIQSKINPINNN